MTMTEHDASVNAAELRSEHEARLRVLQLRAARMGDSTPPEVLTEIDKIRAKLRDLAETLHTVAQSPIAGDIADAIGPVGRYQLTMSHIMRLDGDLSDLHKELEGCKAEMEGLSVLVSYLRPWILISAIGGGLALVLVLLVLVRMY